MRPFDRRRVLLGVTGGIASYKSAWLARLLGKAGAEVDVVLTPAATEFLARLLEPHGALRGRRIVVTAGPTREPVDPVRYLSNRSSGKMGVALAAAAWRRGADVVLVAGPMTVAPPVGVPTRDVETTEEMAAAVERELEQADALIMAAAPADFRVTEPAAAKIQKRAAPESVALAPTPDILASTQRARKKNAVI